MHSYALANSFVDITVCYPEVLAFRRKEVDVSLFLLALSHFGPLLWQLEIGKDVSED